MRNLAPLPSSVLVALLSTLACAGACSAQATSPQTLTSPAFTARQLVLPLQSRIEAQGSSGQRFQILMADDRSWSGVLETGGQVWSATQHDCSAFRAALEALGQLPPLYPGPYDLRDNPQPRQLGPRTPHAESWTLRLAGFAPDHTDVDMEITGSQGPYPRWANDTAEAIRSCGPPAS
jgi:hypothetical protein